MVALVPSTSSVNVFKSPSTISFATPGPTNVTPSSRTAAFTRAGKSGPVPGYQSGKDGQTGPRRVQPTGYEILRKFTPTDFVFRVISGPHWFMDTESQDRLLQLNTPHVPPDCHFCLFRPRVPADLSGRTMNAKVTVDLIYSSARIYCRVGLRWTRDSARN